MDSTTGTVPLRLDKPGTYVVVARQKGFSTGTGTYYAPWSPAVRGVAVAPFDDLDRVPDTRGPSYKGSSTVVGRTVVQKVRIARRLVG